MTYEFPTVTAAISFENWFAINEARREPKRVGRRVTLRTWTEPDAASVDDDALEYGGRRATR